MDNSKLKVPKLMFIGDMHIGRNPIRLPPPYAVPEDFGPIAAWNSAVDLAIEEDVAAIVLAGDVVDCVEDRFEAQRALEPGLARLQLAQKPVYAVVGNHDVKALPRLARLGLGLKILGSGGQWQSTIICHDGRPFCSLLGWSFTRPQEKKSPIATLSRADIPEGLPVLGVLHCDVGQTGSPYAPVRSSEFEVGPASQLAGWFLGHIHAPSHDQLSSDRPCGYLGSLVGLDPGEPGAHGPWIVTVDEQNLQCQQHALGPLVFDRLDLSLSDHESLTDLDIEDKIQSLFRAAVKRNFSESWLKNKNIKAVAIRLTLVGQVTNAARYRKISTRLLEQGDLTHEEDSCLFFVEAMINKLAPHIDFEAIANGTGALSLLAQMVVNSEGNSSDPRVSALIQTMETVAAEPGWQSLSSERHPLPPISELVHENLLAVFSDLHQELMAESEQTL